MPRQISVENNTPVGLDALFKEEAAKLEQSRLFHLIEVELSYITTVGDTSAGLAEIVVVDADQVSVGQTITISGVGDCTVTSIDPVLRKLSLDTVMTQTLTGVEVTFNSILRIVDSNYDITFGGITYTTFPVKFGEISVSSDGTIDKAKLTIANVSREIMYYVQQYQGLRNRRVVVRTVFERFLDETYTIAADGSVASEVNLEADATQYIEDEFLIDSYTADENVVVFALEPVIDLEVKIPRRAYTADSCYWQYKDSETCGYSGPLSTCKKTLADCKAHGNQLRYGGFPGITGNRRIFL